MLPLRVVRRVTASSARPALARLQSTNAALGHFPGTNMPLSGKIEFRDPTLDTPISCFRVVGVDGEVVEGAEDPELGRDLMLQLYWGMVQLNTMDHLLYDAQRQGRISFYATALGEEAVQFRSASALPLQDMVFGQYREGRGWFLSAAAYEELRGHDFFQYCATFVPTAEPPERSGGRRVGTSLAYKRN